MKSILCHCVYMEEDFGTSGLKKDTIITVRAVSCVV